ncbi:heterokaryon incompatibility protein-domain-containing protein [Flammula alnicola]|nr:heterokaryon incompatibility protein-domain-containing protein [Flammula alnicola]
MGKRTAIPPLLPVPTGLKTPTDHLCDVCKSLKLSAERFVVLPSDNETENQPDDPKISLGLVEDMRKKSYCPFCRLVLTALGGAEVPSFEGGQPVAASITWRTEGGDSDSDGPSDHTPKIRVLYLSARKRNGERIDDRRLNLFPEITLLANDAPTSSKLRLIRPIKEDQIDFAMVRNWLSMCENWHGSSCTKSPLFRHEVRNVADEVPAFRLIDVVNNCIVRSPINLKYATLSYVWGSDENRPQRRLVALKSNIDQLERPGAFILPEFRDRIPQTILDTMQVVRELKMRYLWVDSLCIVQDGDPTVKEKAISKMDIVYGACFIMITAATGDAFVGLPGLRPGTRGRRQPIEEVMPGLRLAFIQRYQNEIKDSPYYTRAWTLQEMEFAPRSLVFIGGQVLFRCNKADQWREDVIFEDESVVAEEISEEKLNQSNDIGTFEGAIQTYSARSLTYNSDIYNAFAGLSNYIKSELKVNLCHGIPDAYFDWFLLWTSLAPQDRRPGAPSWSWSGWIGESWPKIWSWYDPSVRKIRHALPKRTWIIWYERVAHNSVECVRVWAPKKPSSSTNFYGGPVQKRFAFDCSRTLPTPRKLVDAPEYTKDILNSAPRSGFLQFWTVSVTFNLDTPTSEADTRGSFNTRSRVGFFGRNGREVGTLFVNPSWHKDHVPGKHEFILLCEGRDQRLSQRAKRGQEDLEPGWKYMVMLIEWHGKGQWAERVSVGFIEKNDLNESLGQGPAWKEIILA